MSKWHEVKADDIDIDMDEQEVNFHIGYDDEGNIYFTLSFDQIKELAAKIEKP